MIHFHVDYLFSDALRAELVSQVKKESPAVKRTRTRVWLGTGALAGTGLLDIGLDAMGRGFRAWLVPEGVGVGQGLRSRPFRGRSIL